MIDKYGKQFMTHPDIVEKAKFDNLYNVGMGVMFASFPLSIILNRKIIGDKANANKYLMMNLGITAGASIFFIMALYRSGKHNTELAHKYLMNYSDYDIEHFDQIMMQQRP